MLEKVRRALRITTDALDEELLDLIEAAHADLGIAGVTEAARDDPLIIRAVITYCRMHFGSPPDFDRLKEAYDEQKAQLTMAPGYTRWNGGAEP
jgi:hypothetical protein